MSDQTKTWTLAIGFVTIVFLIFIMAELREMARVTLFGSRNKGSIAFDTARDIPSLAGKVILITGGAGDLGKQTVIELAKHGRPKRIYIADLPRTKEAKEAVVDSITQEAFGKSVDLGGNEGATNRTEIVFLELDLTQFSSVWKCVDEFKAREDRLDILFLNSGIIRVGKGQTKEGFEIHFGLNYLGHALLSKLLLDTMVQTAKEQPGGDVRLVIVSSEGHAMAPKGGIQFDQLNSECESMSYAQRYGQSKLALICLARVLAQRHPELKVAAIHPGRIITGMARGLQKESLLARITAPIGPFFCVPVSVGIINHLWTAVSPHVLSGTYYEPVGLPGKVPALEKYPDLPQSLWEWTEKII